MPIDYHEGEATFSDSREAMPPAEVAQSLQALWAIVAAFLAIRLTG